jgi:hypothetical protein
MINSANNKCFRCSDKDHFVRDCNVKTENEEGVRALELINEEDLESKCCLLFFRNGWFY